MARDGSHFLSLAIAFVLALPVGWDRARHERTPRLRTVPLVAVASCGYVLLAERELAGSLDAQARITQGLITGIGFVGGGAILKQNGDVKGTATAASIWSTGVTVAYDRYEIAIVLSLINFITLRVLTPIKRNVTEENEQIDQAR